MALSASGEGEYRTSRTVTFLDADALKMSACIDADGPTLAWMLQCLH